MRVKATFSDVVHVCASNRDFVAHVERLTGHTFAFTRPRPPIVAMVDESTGRDAEDITKFVVLVDEIVWSRIQPDAAP